MTTRGDSLSAAPAAAAPARIRRRSLALAAVVAALVSFGLAGNAWCYAHHICRAGHMHHPPYPDWHHQLDLSWSASLVAGALLAWGLPGRWWQLVSTALVCGLLYFRFVLGSMGGISSLPI